MPKSPRTRHRQRPEEVRTEPTEHRLRYRLSATTTPLVFERPGYRMGQDVQRESPQELLGGDRHDLVVLGSEDDRLVIDFRA